MFLPYQEYESRRTLQNLLNEPTGFWREVTRYSASVTFSLLCVYPVRLGRRIVYLTVFIAWDADLIPPTLRFLKRSTKEC